MMSVYGSVRDEFIREAVFHSASSYPLHRPLAIEFAPEGLRRCVAWNENPG
jgi:hypothetical protein